ncbi:MAG TPA: PDZ domain-containing protein [Planctomycetota bacterium]|jgi:Tol biopolymer transport system component
MGHRGLRIAECGLAAAIVLLAISAAAGEMPPDQAEAAHLSNIRQLTFYGAKNGEAYFSPDGKEIVFQGVREEGNPFYQIYRMNLSTGETFLVSTGTGRTTCAFFHPKKPKLIFASTHLDPESQAKQKAEIEKLKSGPPARYQWDFDPNFDIFESDLDGKNLVRLTDAAGYDAEGSYSPDGSKIVFCSFRDGDGEIYVMDSDGKNQTRLTHEKGYDGGPFFSPDGTRIVWRHFEDAAQKVAEVWTMKADGSDKRQITKLNAVSWAPYYHRNGEWIVFASNYQDPAFEIYAIRPDGSDLTRLTFTPGFDGLPVISPDWDKMMWTSNRAENRSQIFIADLNLPGSKPVKAQTPPAGSGFGDQHRLTDLDIAQTPEELKNAAQPYAMLVGDAIDKLRPGEILMRGVGTSPGWRLLAERLAAAHQRASLTLEDDPNSAPDLRPSLEKKIPCVSFSSRTGEGAYAASVAQYAKLLLATGVVKLPYTEYDAAKAKAVATASQRPYLGTVPEYGAKDVVGVKLSGVREDSPAQKAGLKGGDVVTELNGAGIKDVNEYLKALEGVKPGVETTIKILRDGKEQVLKITPGSR